MSVYFYNALCSFFVQKVWRHWINFHTCQSRQHTRAPITKQYNSAKGTLLCGWNWEGGLTIGLASHCSGPASLTHPHLQAQWPKIYEGRQGYDLLWVSILNISASPHTTAFLLFCHFANCALLKKLMMMMMMMIFLQAKYCCCFRQKFSLRETYFYT